MMKNKRPGWNWVEWIIGRIPANYLLVSYLLFVLLFFIYYLFSLKVILFQWNKWYILQILAQCLLIPYLIAGLVYLSEKTRVTFRHIDHLYGNCDEEFFRKIESRVTGTRGYYLILLVSVLGPFIIISWGQWPYFQWEPDSWAWRLDLYGYMLSFLILALLTELLWLIASIVLSINEIGCISDAVSEMSYVFGLELKLRPLKNFFLIFIIYYFIAIALIIYTYTPPEGKLSYEAIYFGVLLAVGVVVFIAGLEAIQRIINCRVEGELDMLNKRRDEQHKLLVKVISSDNSAEKAAEIGYISNVLDIIQKERDSLLQVNRRVYDLSSVSLFISSFLISLLTLLDKLGLIEAGAIVARILNTT